MNALSEKEYRTLERRVKAVNMGAKAHAINNALGKILLASETARQFQEKDAEVCRSCLEMQERALVELAYVQAGRKPSC